MKILAVDTTSNAASAAITEDERLIAEYTLDHKKTHSQKIMLMIDELLKNAELAVGDIDLFAVSNGPGSFTGVRIGVAAMKALAHATKKPIIGVGTLEGLCYNLSCVQSVICPIMDARRHSVYTAAYQWHNQEMTCLIRPCAPDITEYLNQLKNMRKEITFLGDAVYLYRDLIYETLGSYAFFAGTSANVHRASSIAQCAYRKAEKGETDTYLSLQPFYMKKSQAEREYDEKEKNNACNR